VDADGVVAALERRAPAGRPHDAAVEVIASAVDDEEGDEVLARAAVAADLHALAGLERAIVEEERARLFRPREVASQSAEPADAAERHRVLPAHEAADLQRR